MARGKTAGRYTPRRKGRGEKDNSDRWLATYGDMVTLLMAFFVLLYAMSEIDVMKFAAFVEGLAVPFGNVSAEGMMPATDGLLPESQGLQPEQPPPPPTTDPTTVAAVQRRAEADLQLEQVSGSLTDALEAVGIEELVTQRREERGLVISIASDEVLFALGSTEISERGREVIATVADVLDGFPNPLQVEGHTDDLPLRRGAYTNWNLSTDRAVAVLSMLIEDHGLPPDRVGASGYGEYRPLDDNRTRAGRARNRRVDIVVLIDPQFTA
jgi:chemotaxis protein MotB